MLVFGYKQVSCASDFTAEIFKLDSSYEPFNLCFMTSTDRSSKLKILRANVFPPAPPTHKDSGSLLLGLKFTFLFNQWTWHVAEKK